MKERLFSTIDSMYDSYVKVWVDSCNIESPTKYKEGVDAVGNYFADMALARGWLVERFEHPISGDVVAITMNPDSKERPITLSGHMDTVHPVGLFGNPPVRIEDGKMFGPGVIDCKGGIISAFLAMDALREVGFDKRPVLLLLQSDEEGGSAGSNKATIGYMCEKAKDSVAFLNLEGYTPGKACIARKGIITFNFKITGIEAHSSRCATDGANAIAEAAHKIIELEKLKDAAGLTCNCGVISGGSVPNTVAGYCEFKANIRFATTEQLEWVCDYVKKVADTTYIKGCVCELEQSGFRVAMQYEERNQKLLDRMNEIFEEVGMSTLEAIFGSGGSDAADATAYGIPCIDCMGVFGGRIHSPDEFADIDSLRESAKRLAAVAYYI